MAWRREPSVKFGQISPPSVQRVEKPQNRPLSKLKTGRFALRAMLPVKIYGNVPGWRDFAHAQRAAWSLTQGHTLFCQITPFLQRAQLHCMRCISYGNSVRPSVCRHTPVLCQNDGTLVNIIGVFQAIFFIQGPRYTSGGPRYTPRAVSYTHLTLPTILRV